MIYDFLVVRKSHYSISAGVGVGVGVAFELLLATEALADMWQKLTCLRLMTFC